MFTALATIRVASTPFALLTELFSSKGTLGRDWVLHDRLLHITPKFHFFKMKYILVSGGVISGVGKGVISSSLGMLLKSEGLRVTSIKIDPYLNIDAGRHARFPHVVTETL